MWMQVGKVKADVQKLTIKDLQVSKLNCIYLVGKGHDDGANLSVIPWISFYLYA